MFDFRKQLAQRYVPDKYYVLRLEALLSRAANGSLPPHELFAEVSDDFWLWLNTEGMRQSPDLAQILPALPEESVQLNSNGIAGDLAMVDAFVIHRWVKAIFEAYVGDFSRCHNLLDFGVGWGRVIRFFLNCLDPSRLWGVDHYNLHIDIAKETNKWCQFELIASYPPTSFDDDMFDLVFAYSVFSHLSEEIHVAWLEEFQRILRPGGLLIATTWERDLILRCAKARENSDAPLEIQTHLPRMFLQTEQWLSRYDAGEFCFDTARDVYGETASFQGETCIPKDYVRQKWARFFEYLDFLEDRRMCSQNVIVVRKQVKKASAA